MSRAGRGLGPPQPGSAGKFTLALVLGAFAFGCGTAQADQIGPASLSAGPSPVSSSRDHRDPPERRRTAPKPSPIALVNLPSYWPMFTTDEIRRFDYTAPDGSLDPITSIFRYDPATKSMLYQEYNSKMEWQDTWFYRSEPGYGIAEWRDDYPMKSVVMTVPIGWGENMPIGGVYRNTPVISLLRSNPPQLGIGWQTVRLEAVLDEFTTNDGTTYHDVAKFLYQQGWGFQPAAGARYWMAKGVGPVAIQWVAENPLTGQMIEAVRIDAVVSSTVSAFPAPPTGRSAPARHQAPTAAEETRSTPTRCRPVPSRTPATTRSAGGTRTRR